MRIEDIEILTYYDSAGRETTEAAFLKEQQDFFHLREEQYRARVADIVALFQVILH